MGDQLCQVIVNNVPNHAEGYIVARINEETRSLWYWGCWDNKADADECAANVNGIVLRRVNHE